MPTSGALKKCFPQSKSDEMEMNCDKCENKLEDFVVLCDGLCKRRFHPNCANLADDAWTTISHATNAKWYCNQCLLYIELILKNGINIAEIKKLFEEKIVDIENKLTATKNAKQNAKTKTYAQATGEVLVIKPKRKQESSITKEALMKSCNPATLEVGITQVKNIKEGGILIKCNSKEEVEKIRSATEKKLKRSYDIRLPNQINPRIKIVGIEEDMDKETIEEMIRKQNACLIKEHHLLDVKIIKKMRTRYMAIAECDPSCFSLLVESGKLSIGWSRCSVYEYVPVFRCYKCGNFDHKASECTEEDRCLLCTSVSHKTENCNEKVKCHNCVLMNEKFSLKLNVEHNIFDLNCSVYLRKVEAKRKYIKLPVNNSQ